MSASLWNETELLLGLGAVMSIWSVIVGLDIWRRAKGLKRRATSPVRQWLVTMVMLWGLAAVSVWAWMASGRTLHDLGFRAGEGLFWGTAWGMAIAFIAFQAWQIRTVARDEAVRGDVRRMIFDSGDYDQVMPRRRQDSWGFFLLSITAGITEEIVFRAFLISLFALILPVWAAALIALALFVLGHAYQGVQGLVRILPVSIVLTLCYVLSGSLWPGIFLHICVDVLSGVMVWLVLPKDGYVQLEDVAAQPSG